ncbi:hypothetical protein MUK42_05451 [Musa troglodytarum]|uniref:Uncharacterized protein n=1 Tax=Musa troglodytarum TaxID=320322 RepID=A0A9E7EP96_9LILI|nr:hypothetical protein MUK42_05451 [Musa troglodytarum]
MAAESVAQSLEFLRGSSLLSHQENIEGGDTDGRNWEAAAEERVNSRLPEAKRRNRGDRRWRRIGRSQQVLATSDVLRSSSKYSVPKSSSSSTLSTLLLLLLVSLSFAFLLIHFLLMECLLFSATAGDTSSSSFQHLMPFNDSCTRSTGKLSTAIDPLIEKAAWSYARAAASALSNVPSHTRIPCRVESLISAANFPHGRFRTPRYDFSFGSSAALLRESTSSSLARITLRSQASDEDDAFPEASASIPSSSISSESSMLKGRGTSG